MAVGGSSSVHRNSYLQNLHWVQQKNFGLSTPIGSEMLVQFFLTLERRLTTRMDIMSY